MSNLPSNPLDTAKSHTEKIKCPECGTVQEAKVYHTGPFWSYVHRCKKCGYQIMESEWNTIRESEPRDDPATMQ
jgi:C4-type Zn-finger protein